LTLKRSPKEALAGLELKQELRSGLGKPKKSEEGSRNQENSKSSENSKNRREN